jgi:FkbM family methyltransferase
VQMPMKNMLRELETRWGFLKTQHGFRRAPALTTMRLVSWLIRCIVRKAAVLKLGRWDVRMFLPANWRGFGKFIFVFREHYEPELTFLEKILSPGNVFVDAGANFGIYTLVASKLVGKTGRVVAFEPTAQSFAILRQNIALNGLTNIVTFSMALSEKAGKAWLYHGPDPVRNSLGKAPSWAEEAEEVAVESLDNVLGQASIERVDVIKIDVEGAEELVLRGANNTLRTMRPIVIFEINPEASACLDLHAYGASKLLKSLGYEFLIIDEQARGNNAKLRPPYFNVVAVPGQAKEEFSSLVACPNGTDKSSRPTIGNC